MPSLQVRAAPPCAIAIAIAMAAAAALTACASSRLSAEAPPGVRLAGDWKLDGARSDDLGKAIEQLRAQARKARRGTGSRQPQGTPGSAEGPAGGHRRPRRGSGPGSAGQGDQTENESEPGAGGDEIGAGAPRFSTVDELMSTVPRGDYLKISVTPGAFTVTSGDSSDQYTPGLESEISAEQGDAQQISGWKGQDYVVDTKPQWGAEIIQSYGLSKDGRLTMTIRLTGSRTRFTFTRVYDRTTRVAPLAPPTIN